MSFMRTSGTVTLAIDLTIKRDGREFAVNLRKDLFDTLTKAQATMRDFLEANPELASRIQASCCAVQDYDWVPD